jgi:hypothetical protein
MTMKSPVQPTSAGVPRNPLQPATRFAQRVDALAEGKANQPPAQSGVVKEARARYGRDARPSDVPLGAAAREPV